MPHLALSHNIHFVALAISHNGIYSGDFEATCQYWDQGLELAEKKQKTPPHQSFPVLKVSRKKTFTVTKKYLLI